MPRPHDAVISTSEFWRVLVFVLIGFGAALALSWSIDTVVSGQTAAIAAPASHV